MLEANIFPSHDITVFPKCRAKRLTQWMIIIHLILLVGVLLQVRCKRRNSVGGPLSIVEQTKLPRILVQKTVAKMALSML